jgi:uncharacterized protein YbaR (Trm112 family)
MSGVSQIDPELLAILACPSDHHGPLLESTVAGLPALTCPFCLSSFPIRDGIPVLLSDDATPGPNGLGHAAHETP